MSDVAHGASASLTAAKVSAARFGAPISRSRPGGLFAVNGAILRAVAGLASLNLASRVLSGASLLLSAVVFAPGEFARFGALLAALNLAGAVMFLRYEAALVAARSQAEFRAALRLTALVGLGMLLIAAVSTALLAKAGWIHGDLALLFVLALAGRGACRILGQIAVRDGRFRLIGQATLSLAAIQPFVVLIAFATGTDGAVAMALSDILGNLVAAIYLARNLRRPLEQALWPRPEDPRLRGVAHAWRALPLVNLPASALAVAFASVPLLATLSLADAVTAGHVALAFRLLEVPAQVLAAAISPIAMNRFGGHGRSLPQRRDPALVLWLCLAAAGLFGGLTLLALAAEPLLAGTEWAGLSAYVPLVALFQCGVALALPLIEVANLRHDQRQLLVIQAGAVLLMGLLVLFADQWQAALLGFGLVALLRAALLGLPLALRPAR